MWEMPFTVVRVTARIIYTTLKAGFSMIATITVMAAITEKSLTIVAIVAIIWKPAFNLRLLQISQFKKKVFLFYEKM